MPTPGAEGRAETWSAQDLLHKRGMRQFLELWAGFTIGQLLFSVLSNRGRVAGAEAVRAIIVGLIAAGLLTMYYAWRAAWPAPEPDGTEVFAWSTA